MYEPTPKAIKQLIVGTCAATLGVALADSLLAYSVGLTMVIQRLLIFSGDKFTDGFIWQPFTYLFVHPSYGLGVSYSLLIELLFNMYLLWIIGASVVAHIGSKAFVSFYVLSGAACALLSLPLMILFHSYATLAGSLLPLLSSLCLWTMLFPDAQLVLFYLIPLSAKRLIVFIVGASLLIDLSQGAWVHLAASLIAVTLGLVAGVAIWNVTIPYERLRWMERAIIRVKRGWPRGPRKKQSKGTSSGKVVDLQSGRPVDSDDEVFLDSILDKISHQGEASLTSEERRRLEKISENKSRNPQR